MTKKEFTTLKPNTMLIVTTGQAKGQTLKFLGFERKIDNCHYLTVARHKESNTDKVVLYRNEVSSWSLPYDFVEIAK